MTGTAQNFSPLLGARHEGPRTYRGGWRAEKRKPMVRALRHVGASRRANHGVHTAPGPALVRSVTLERVDRSFSLLQAGAPIGPGGSSDAARVLMLRP